MMGERRVDLSALLYEFSLERHVPTYHKLRAIDRFVELDGLRAHLAPSYSAIGRPSIDPELLIRMLLVGYCFGIRSERRLCEEAHSIWPIVGSASWAWTVMCRTTRPSRRTAMAVFATVICCVSCSRRCCAAAWPRVWSAARALRSTPA